MTRHILSKSSLIPPNAGFPLVKEGKEGFILLPLHNYGLINMRMISFIEEGKVIHRIRKNLGLWFSKSRPTPETHSSPAGYGMDYFSLRPTNDDHT